MAGCGVGVVPADALGPELTECPVCGDTGPRKRGLILQDAPEVVLLECGKCHAESASRMPTDAFLASLYDPSTYQSSLVSDTKLATRCAGQILDAAGLDMTKPLEILDYGGSDGTLSLEVLRLLRDRGHKGHLRATVVDLFPRPSSAEQRFVTPADFERDDTKYNLLLASAVLEHLRDIAPAMRSMARAAAPGARFYARTPYDVPLARWAPGYKVKWPRHLHDLGPAFWDHVLETFDLRGKVLVSRPSIVETSLKQAAARTVLAHVLKAPAHFENTVIRPALGYRPRLWHLVGGWEVIIEFGGR